MKISKKISWLIVLFLSHGSNSLYAERFKQNTTLISISDDQLRGISGANQLLGLSQIQQIQQKISISTQSSTTQPSPKVGNVTSVEHGEFLKDFVHQWIAQSFMQHGGGSLNGSVGLNNLQIREGKIEIQLKNTHIERIEVGMNMEGLYQLGHVFGMPPVFTSSLK